MSDKIEIEAIGNPLIDDGALSGSYGKMAALLASHARLLAALEQAPDCGRADCRICAARRAAIAAAKLLHAPQAVG